MAPQYFFYRTDGILKRIILDEIVYLEASNNYTIFYGPKDKHVVRANLDAVLKQMPPNIFARANRSQAVALQYINQVMKDSVTFNYWVENEVTLTRQYYNEFVEKLTILEPNPGSRKKQ